MDMAMLDMLDIKPVGEIDGVILGIMGDKAIHIHPDGQIEDIEHTSIKDKDEGISIYILNHRAIITKDRLYIIERIQLMANGYMLMGFIDEGGHACLHIRSGVDVGIDNMDRFADYLFDTFRYAKTYKRL